jgi:arsenite methyltransferase
VRAWFAEADLVNTTISGTGQTCCAESQTLKATSAKGQTASISIFAAAGTRRLKMRGAVQEAYAAAAQSDNKSGCSCSTEPAQSQSDASTGSCCSSEPYLPTQSVTFKTDYSLEERSQVPADAEEISLGCGNPIAMANLRPGEVVLDIGSGGGMDSFLAARRVGPSGKVIGVDMTPAMLERATRTAQSSGITNVEFRLGQAEKMPVEDGSVDVVLSNCVINLCEDKGQVFREAYRVLRFGGRLEVSDMVTSAPLPMESRQKAGEWAGCVSGALPESEYLDLIAQAGFSNISTRRSVSAGEEGGVSIYSAIVSARKEAAPQKCCCG